MALSDPKKYRHKSTLGLPHPSYYLLPKKERDTEKLNKLRGRPPGEPRFWKLPQSLRPKAEKLLAAYVARARHEGKKITGPRMGGFVGAAYIHARYPGYWPGCQIKRRAAKLSFYAMMRQLRAPVPEPPTKPPPKKRVAYLDT